MAMNFDKIDVVLDKIALQAVMIEPDDIPGFGILINLIKDLKDLVKNSDNKLLIDLVSGVENYIGKLILFETEDVSILNKGITSLQEIVRAIKQNDEYNNKDLKQLLNDLGLPEENINLNNKEEDGNHDDGKDKDVFEPEKLLDEDISIMADFVIEASENLATIEINLIELEQNPDDNDIINDIFRPFHTIKGVSGFLNLDKINRLSHNTENLLDSARQGQITIDNKITDIILLSVDTLNHLIKLVNESALAGETVDDSAIDIESLIKEIKSVLDPDQSVSQPLIGEMLVEEGSITNTELKESLDIQKKLPEKKIGDILIEKNIVKKQKITETLIKQKGLKKSGVKPKAVVQVKVDTKKLDDLVELSGELVIAHSMLKENNSLNQIKDQGLVQNLSRLTRIIIDIQKISMSMRMVPIKSTFQKMIRLVRDLAKNTQKSVVLEMVGEDTEIDRNVVEALYEPMVHMIRNSVDHGIESPDIRVAANKEKYGTIVLKASHRAGNIEIEIKDDGYGLNKQLIFDKAVSKDLVTKDAKLTDSEIFNLIFHPGFSTADKVTDVSGRGVGMDVVKKAIENLRGHVEISSKQGSGSTFKISLPLTLAIIEGMLISVGNQRYVVPTNSIVKSFKLEKKDYTTIGNKNEMVMVMGDLIPLIRINKIFKIKEKTKDQFAGVIVVVINKNRKKALLIDELLGKDEFVIKNLGETFKGIRGVAGGAILGDGRVGLIIDMAGLFDVAGSIDI